MFNSTFLFFTGSGKFLRKVSFLFCLFLTLHNVNGQSNPTPHDLSISNYSFTGFANGTITTYPASMQGHKFPSERTTANLVANADGDRVLANNTSGIATGSIRNEIANGISLLNSGSNHIGAILVALNSTGRESLSVTFTAEQLISGGNGATDRINGLRLQYRIGNTGDFTDVSATEYLTTNTTALNGSQTFSSVNLPSACNNQSIVHLRWIYYISSGTANGRDRIRLDEISVSSSAATSNPTVTTTAATSIATTSADLNGTINANGTITDASFEYGTSVSYGNTIAATPATVTGSTATSITAALSSLAVNTQYFYRAVGTVSGTPTNGDNQTFYTLAATPGASVVNNPQLTTLDVTVNSSTENGNPSATVYAIQETGGQYIQANGTLGATAVWQTAATWGTVTVTGLTASTNYTFQVKARNGANVETAFGTTASGTTLTPETVDYAVVQFPNTTQTITEGGQITVYIRAYENGITTPAGASTRLKAWVGYSSTNDNPANVGWTWVPATFNVQVGNDDEYQANIGAGLTPGTYYYAARFEIDDSGVFVYGGSSGNWNNNSVTLNVNADVVNFANIQFPTSATITEGATVTVFAQVYEPGVTEGAGQGSGITAEIGYSSTNSSPDGTWTWLSATHNASVTGNNDEYQVNLGTGLSPGTYYYASRFIKTGSSTYVYGGTNGSPWTTSGVLTVNALGTPTATAGTSIGQTQFTANWDAVSGATGYRLDVSTNINFQTTNSQNLFEGFTTYVAQSTFNNFTMTGTGNYTTTASSGTSGPNSIQFNDTNDRLVSPNFPGALTSLSFWIRGNGTNAISSFLIEGFNGTSWQTIQNITNSIPTVGTIYNYTSSSSPALPNNVTQIRFTYTKGNGNLAFDDFSVNYNEIIPSFIIEDLNVGNVTSYQVTGLDPNTTYYYRVRAVNNSVTSSNSNVIEVMTRPTTVTWNGTAWSNIDGPDATIDAIIGGAYTTVTNGGFTAKSLTVESGSFTVSAGTNVTVVNEVTNELTAADFVVENNANLIQDNDTNNVGAITVNRNSSALMRLDYTLWSSPVASQNLLSFSPLTMANRFYVYNPSNNQYAAVTPSTTDFAEGTGYLIRMPDTHPTMATTWSGSFVGVPHNGDVTITVTNNTYNAVGNPYPSTIDADDFINDNNLTEALYFWRKTNAAVGSAYATYTLAGGAGTGGSGNSSQIPNGIIQVGQGFIARSTSTSLVFNNLMRVADNNNQFFRSATNSLSKSRIWLNLNQENTILGQTMVAYMEGTTTDLDAKYDGKYINDSQTAITSVINNEEYAVQARGEFAATDVVPITIKLETAGNYTISLAQVDGVFSTEHDIFVRDIELGVEHDVRTAPYTFSAPAGVLTNRFELVFQSTLSVENPIFNNVVVFSKNKALEINAGNEIISSVSVFDIRGRKVAAQEEVNSSAASLDLSGVSNQVLIVQIKTSNGQLITKKVVH
ncbi:MAG: fibronectin type III domain-containing protein [Flavobacterium sp.]|jgi:hypothetical protein|uniref:fibronectin type III domain-containing protein n=1 Tax=Flavobacterium sp. TaxID=239 RepID=UPI003BA67E53